MKQYGKIHISIESKRKLDAIAKENHRNIKHQVEYWIDKYINDNYSGSFDRSDYEEPILIENAQ